MDERELIRQMQAGDFEAFIELLRPHKDRIYALVYRLVIDSEIQNDQIVELELNCH